MTEPGPDTTMHPEIEAQLSEYYEGSLDAERMRDIQTHLADCAPCRSAYEQLETMVGALSGLHKMSAPQHFESGVQETIRRRSAGRFFGRKAFGDRIPFELLAILALVTGLIIFFLIRSSRIGSLRYDTPPAQPYIAPGARDVVPQVAPGEHSASPQSDRVTP